MSDTAKKYVVLISPNEKLRFLVDDTTIIYRRLPPSKRRDLLAEHSVRGTFDAMAVLGLELSIAQYCIRGWENLLDAEGKPVPFLEEVIQYLPLTIIQRVGELALDASPDELMERFQSFFTKQYTLLRPGGQPITCWSCRALLAEDEEPVPCDTGGLPACLYWRTHGYSPGEKDHPDDRFAWEVYWQMQRVGWEAVKTLRKLDQLDEYEADCLLTRLVAMHDVVQAHQQDRPATR